MVSRRKRQCKSIPSEYIVYHQSIYIKEEQGKGLGVNTHYMSIVNFLSTSFQFSVDCKFDVLTSDKINTNYNEKLISYNIMQENILA